MSPVFQSSLERAQKSYADDLPKKAEAKSVGANSSKQRNVVKEPGIETILSTLTAGAEPLQDFLRTHSHPRERQFFARSRQSAEQADAQRKEDLFSLIPAFLISELQEAFTIGFLLFLPFLVIDLVVANILIGLGMSMMSPVTISLPIKLLLFVLCDGWFLLSKGLVLGYLQGG
jgi:type III secretion protein R